MFQNPFSGTAPHDVDRRKPRVGVAAWQTAAASAGPSTGAPPHELRDRIRTLNMGLEDRLDNAIGSLSGGQRQALTLSDGRRG